MRLYRNCVASMACIVLLGACEQNGKSDEDEEETPPIPVETSVPVRGDIFAVYSGTAPIEAFAQAEVVAKVAGEVRQLLVEEGDDVTSGEILARLDGDRLRLELNESQARLRKLQRDFERNKDLREKGLISEGDFENIQYELEALQASYNLARLELDYTQIRAPIDGVVSERFIKLGNTIRVGDPVFRVTSLDPLVAYLHIPEREYQRIRAGQPVQIDIDALAGGPVTASVTRVSPVVDAATGTFKTTIEISDPERRIKPGMFGRMNIVYDRRENVLQVPRSTVVEDAGVSSVFIVQDDIAIRRVVETGFGAGGFIEIISGLEDGDDVITLGQVGIKPDATVTVINRPADAPADVGHNEEDDNEEGDKAAADGED